MKQKLKIITSILVWLGWYIALVSTANPNYTWNLLPSIPANPFAMIKYLFWDNPLAVTVSLLWFVAASCATYVYIKIYESLWEGKSETTK